MSSRRDVVKWLAGAPALGAISWSAAQTDRAAQHLRALAELGNPGPYAPKFFTAHEWRTVVVLVDYVIPRDARSGSATDAKVPEFMDFILVDAETSVESRTAMRGGLAWLDLACEDRAGKTFAACDDAERRRVLDEIAWPKRARPEMSQGVAFFTHFRDFTASGFFSTEMGWKDLRYLGNTPVAEWKGCPAPVMAKLGVSFSVMDAKPPK